MPRMGRQDSECSTAPLDPYMSKTDYREPSRAFSSVCVSTVCVVLLLLSLVAAVWLVFTWLSFSQQIAELKLKYEKVEERRGWETNNENVSALVDEALQKYLAERDHVEVGPPLPSGWVSGPDRPMAHLTGNPEPNHYPKREENEVIKIRTWETEHGLATLANGMEYNRGNIIIPADGLYYIYSQLSYRFRNDLPEDVNKEERIFQIIHYTYKRNSYPEPKQIMKTAKSTCWSKRVEFGLYTSFQGGVFQLEKGDRIWVSVSNAPLICFDETSSFFGAFMLY
ncbi:tumor necrosis factor ligand superfamily member 10-like [Branchiostoma lanceolatum]|uniref:tumor necrosis factor ligand superfamily member 10-like n=1 Tax=Branchiostoma lanceolatum TaxID=7740 RepID=UPI003455BE18